MPAVYERPSKLSKFQDSRISMSRFYLQTDSQKNLLKKTNYHSELSINNTIISEFLKKKI
jgi:hypothetical protein